MAVKKRGRFVRFLLAALAAMLVGCDDVVSPGPAPVPGACTDYAAYSHWAGAWDSDRSGGGIALVGGMAYLLSGRTADIADISTPGHPRWIRTTAFIDAVSEIVVRGDVAYAAGSASLIVLDVRDPAHPQMLGNELVLDGVRDLDAAGGYVYAATGTGLQVIDVHNSADPQRAGGLTFTSPVSQVAVIDGYAYITMSYAPGLTVVDVGIPDMPRVVGNLPSQSFFTRLAASGGRLYATQFGGVAVIDVTNPRAPRVAGTAPTVQPPGELHAEANRIYVTGSQSFRHHVEVFEVPASGRPAPFVTLPMSGDLAPQGLAARGTDLFVADFRRGLQVFSVVAARGLEVAGSFGIGDRVQDIAMAGPLLYAAAWERGLVIADLADAQHPRILGRADTPDVAEGVAVAGNYAYVANWEAGLYIVDVSVPAAPRVVGSVDTPGYAKHVAVEGTYAYVADNLAGLQVVDVANPAVPRLIAHVSTPGIAIDVAVRDGFAYVATFGALEVVDVHDPALPVHAGSAPCGGAWSVVLQGPWAYVAGGSFDVISIATPQSPVRVASIPPPGEFRGIALAGGVAYLADVQYGLVAFDIATPATPHVLGSIGLRGLLHRAVIGSDRLVVAGLDAGVVFAPLHCP